MGINVGLLAEYSSIYPELNENIDELSKGIPKDIIIKSATYFLSYEVIDHKENNWLAIANMWFRAKNRHFAEDLEERIHTHYGHQEKGLAVLFAISSLKLLQLGLEKENEVGVDVKDEAAIEIDMFKIYLLFNESFTVLQTRSAKYIEDHYSEILIGLLMLNMSFAVSDLINFIIGREYFCQTIKAFFLFDFLNKEPKMRPHLNAFFGKYNIKSMENYYTRVVPFIKSIGGKTKDGFIEFNIKHDDDYQTNKDFITKLAVSDYSPNDDIDFRLVRSAPLVQIDEDSYRVTHPLFFTDKLYKGLYFEFSKIHDDLNDDQKKAVGAFRTFYTSNFSEKYLLYEVIRYCIKDKYIQYSGAELDALHIQGAPDYYIRDGKYVILIENKDILIKASVKENPLFEDIETELKKKFLDDNGKAVGIKQIVSNIERVLLNKNEFDNNYKGDKAVIYPVLIVHDIVYDTPGINHLFNVWFSEELNKLNQKGLAVEKVKRLIVLNIDSLIRAAQVLRTGQAKIREILEIYLLDTIVTQKKFKSQEHLEQVLTHQYLPSTKIIEDWLFAKHSELMQHNDILKYAFNLVKAIG
jgi:hypothetical protein